jgi:hypothetical protein
MTTEKTTKVYSLEVTEREAEEVMGERVKVRLSRAWIFAVIAGVILLIAGVLEAIYLEPYKWMAIIVILAGFVLAYILPMARISKMRMDASRGIIGCLPIVGKWNDATINSRLVGKEYKAEAKKREGEV